MNEIPLVYRILFLVVVVVSILYHLKPFLIAMGVIQYPGDKDLEKNQIGMEPEARRRLMDLTIDLFSCLRLADQKYVMARVRTADFKIDYMQTYDGNLAMPFRQKENRIMERYVKFALGRFARELIRQHQLKKTTLFGFQKIDKSKSVSVIVRIGMSYECKIQLEDFTELYFDVETILRNINSAEDLTTNLSFAIEPNSKTA